MCFQTRTSGGEARKTMFGDIQRQQVADAVFRSFMSETNRLNEFWTPSSPGQTWLGYLMSV
jgi:hypothetical protein